MRERPKRFSFPCPLSPPFLSLFLCSSPLFLRVPPAPKNLTLLDVLLVGLVGAQNGDLVDLRVLQAPLERGEVRARGAEGGLGARPRVLLEVQVAGEGVAGGEGGGAGGGLLSFCWFRGGTRRVKREESAVAVVAAALAFSSSPSFPSLSLSPSPKTNHSRFSWPRPRAPWTF